MKHKYLDIIKHEPYKIGHWLGFKDLVPLHNDWIKSFLFAEEDRTLLAHRGSFKTTCLAIAIGLMMIIYPDKNIIFLRKTDTDVIEIIKQVAKMLKSDVVSEMIREIYGFDLQFTVESGSEINTNLSTSSRGTSQLIGVGINASITGKHGDIIVTDDIVNLKDRISKAERNRTKAAYMELQNVKNRGGRFINTGTPWHKEDAISSMPNVKRFTCWETGLISKEQITKLRDSMTTSLFAANYELKHIADAESLFGSPNTYSNIERIYNGVGQIDASYGGSDGTAFTIMKKQKDGAFVAVGFRWDKHVDECLDEIYILWKHYKCGTIHTESNADKGYLKKELKKYGMPALTYHESMNKFIKISTHLKKQWKNIYWLDDTHNDYLNEILDYTENAEHDDAPDSAATLVRRMEKRGMIV